MICKNCGAEYDDNLIQCPYCEAENTQKVYQNHYEYIDDLKKRTTDVKNLSNKITNTSTSIFVKGIVAFVVIIVIVLIIGFIWAKANGAIGLENQEKDLEKLESLYQSGNYNEMLEYYYDCDSRGGAFEKYYRIGSVYGTYEWAVSDVDNLKTYAGFVKDGTAKAELMDTDIKTCLKHIFEAMSEIAEYREEGYLYGEEEVLEQIDGNLYEILEEELFWAEDKIEELLKEYRAKGEECFDTKMIENIKEGLLGE